MPRLLWFALLLLPLPAQALSLTGEVRWRGRLTQSEMVRVEPGASLTIEPGTTITFNGGGLEVAGKLQASDARLSGRDWEGVILKGTGADTRLSNCTIEGAKTGIQVLGGAPRLEAVTVTGNQVGMDLRQNTAALLSRCIFRENAKVGLLLKDGVIPAVTGGRFENNGKFGAYLFRSAPREFRDNLFRGNATGLMVTHFGSDPVIQGNRFEHNTTGIQVDRAARPLLTGNLLSGNQTAIQLSRRSDPRIEGNRLQDNRTGIAVSFSSYPRIQGNDLDGNQQALVLDHQSSSWEEANGESAREGEAGRGAFGQTPKQTVSEADRRPKVLTGTVDARGNWWGSERTLELERIGARGNPSFIVDGQDNPSFVDGGIAYPLDQVLFSPWLAAPATKGKIK